MKDLMNIFKNTEVGTKFYSPVCGEVSFVGITKDTEYPIEMNGENDSATFNRYGKWYNNESAECVLFPSQTQRDWDLYEVEQSYRKFKDGDIIIGRYSDNKEVIAILKGGQNHKNFFSTYVVLIHKGGLFCDMALEVGTSGWRLATDGEKQKLFDGMAEYGKVWNAEKKCVEATTTTTKVVIALMEACVKAINRLGSTATTKELEALKELKEKLDKC